MSSFVNWCAIWTRGRHEKKVASELAENGIEHFLPLIKQTRQWSDRKKVVDLAFFPGYLFARLIPEEIHVLYKIRGVVRILGYGDQCAAVSSEEIEAIRRVTCSSLPTDLYPTLPIGRQVRVINGALSGLKGTLVRWKDNHSVVITVNLIQQGAAVILSPQDVEPL